MREGPNSLLSVLRGRRLVFELKAEYTASVGVAFFRIICRLSENGKQSVATVIHIIFQVSPNGTVPGLSSLLLEDNTEYPYPKPISYLIILLSVHSFDTAVR